MGIRETSRDSLRSVIDSGCLGKMQRIVYAALYNAGQSTANELYSSIVNSKIINQANIGTRLGELREMGVVREIGKRTCRVTLQTVLVWEVTGNMPVKLPKKKTKKEKKETILALLRDFYKQEHAGEKSKIYIKRIATEVKGL